MSVARAHADTVTRTAVPSPAWTVLHPCHGDRCDVTAERTEQRQRSVGSAHRLSAMSGGKKRSGFQITSVTSDVKLTPDGQSAGSAVLSGRTSTCSLQGSSSQPTTPSLKRKQAWAEAPGQDGSRFRVVRLSGGGAGGRPYRRGRWTCTEFMERQEGAGFRRLLDTVRHAHSLGSLEMVGREAGRGGVHSQGAAHLPSRPGDTREDPGVGLGGGPPSPSQASVRVLDSGDQLESRTSPPPVQLDTAGQLVLRLSQSQPSSPPAASTPRTPRTPAAFSLDQAIFNLPQGASGSSNNLIAIDNKIEQAMDLVKSHLMLAVREEVELLKEQIRELQDKNQHLERENLLLRTLAHDTPEHTHNT